MPFGKQRRQNLFDDAALTDDGFFDLGEDGFKLWIHIFRLYGGRLGRRPKPR